jgi:hypothetical protein
LMDVEEPSCRPDPLSPPNSSCPLLLFIFVQSAYRLLLNCLLFHSTQLKGFTFQLTISGRYDIPDKKRRICLGNGHHFDQGEMKHNRTGSQLSVIKTLTQVSSTLNWSWCR